MLLWLQPLIGITAVVSTIVVAILGWRYRLTRAPGSAELHRRWGKRLLLLLALAWITGLGSVFIANRPNSPAAMSGDFINASIILAGYSVSAFLMLTRGRNKWVRRLHVTANTILLLFVLYQVLLGVNRLYKFDLLSEVPQSQTVRSVLQIKFGLQSPPTTAEPGRTYPFAKLDLSKPYGGAWTFENGVISQTDCGCSGNGLLDTLTIDGRFPLLVFDQPVAGDFTASADFQIVSGHVDQYAGLAFRIVDENNYYVVRASASEQSVSLARFNNGSRQVLQVFPASVTLGKWQTLAVQVAGQKFAITLDGKPIGEVVDDGWPTGRIGLGTKADSVSRFRNLTATVPEPPPSALTLERTIALDDAAGRIDHMAVDLKRQRLFVAELGRGAVDVIDLSTGKVVKRISPLSEPQGVAFDPNSDLVAISSGGDGSVRFFRGDDLTPAGSVLLGSDADNIQFEPGTGRFFVGYGNGALAIIDPVTRAVTGKVDLAGHPESFQLLPDVARALVNVPEANQIAVVDLKALRQIATWQIKDAGNYPIVEDVALNRVAVALRSTARLVLLDAATGNVAQTLPVCSDADDTFLDAKRHRLLISCGEGVVDILEGDAAGYRPLATVTTSLGARTSLWVPELDRYFVARPAELGMGAAILVYRPD